MSVIGGLNDDAVVTALELLLLLLLLLWAMLRYRRQTLVLRARQLELQRLLQVEHDRLEIEVAQRTAQLTGLAQRLQTAREDERNRLARDLHDGVLQSFTGIGTTNWAHCSRRPSSTRRASARAWRRARRPRPSSAWPTW